VTNNLLLRRTISFAALNLYLSIWRSVKYAKCYRTHLENTHTQAEYMLIKLYKETYAAFTCMYITFKTFEVEGSERGRKAKEKCCARQQDKGWKCLKFRGG